MSPAPTAAGSPLLRMTQTTPTQYWNDSCAADDLEYAIDRGATGATSNPSIVLEVMRCERERWEPRVFELAAAHPTWSEVELAWAISEEIAVRAAGVLAPVFERAEHRAGRLSFQVDPADHRDPDRMLEQAVRFAALAPNIQVKFPVTAAGLVAIEEATARGINITATVSFTVAQAIAAAEAVERGLDRRPGGGDDGHVMAPMVVLMIGRLDDWMKVLVERDALAVHPAAPAWAGIAVFKRAYAQFRERGYRSRLLAAAYRHRLHWTELVGADASLTLTHAWQVRFNRSGIDPGSADRHPGGSGARRRPVPPRPRLPPRLRPGRHDAGRVRRLRCERPDAACLHPVPPRPAGGDPGSRAPGPGHQAHLSEPRCRRIVTRGTARIIALAG